MMPFSMVPNHPFDRWRLPANHPDVAQSMHRSAASMKKFVVEA